MCKIIKNMRVISCLRRHVTRLSIRSCTQVCKHMRIYIRNRDRSAVSRTWYARTTEKQKLYKLNMCGRTLRRVLLQKRHSAVINKARKQFREIFCRADKCAQVVFHLHRINVKNKHKLSKFNNYEIKEHKPITPYTAAETTEIRTGTYAHCHRTCMCTLLSTSKLPFPLGVQCEWMTHSWIQKERCCACRQRSPHAAAEARHRFSLACMTPQALGTNTKNTSERRKKRQYKQNNNII